MALTSFCGLLTLQVGVSILAGVFLTLSGVILAVNIFDFKSDLDLPINLLLVAFFVLGLIVAGLFMFLSTYNEERKKAMVGLYIVAALLCFWLIFCCFSFISSRKNVDKVCIQTRCPETFWLVNLYWRDFHCTYWDEKNVGTNVKSIHKVSMITKPKPYFPIVHSSDDRFVGESLEIGLENGYIRFKSEKSEEDSRGKINVTYLSQTSHSMQEEITLAQTVENTENNLSLNWDVFGNKSKLYNSNHSDQIMSGRRKRSESYIATTGKKDDDSLFSHIQSGLPLFGMIFLFVINLIFLLFSAYVLWSWASELKNADYDEGEDPTDFY